MANSNQRYTLKRTVAPASEPITTAEAKSNLRVDISDDDTLIGNLIAAAREELEGRTSRAFVTQTWQMKLDRFPLDVIEVPICPLATVTSITYLDSAGDSQTLSTDIYTVDTVSEPGRITRKYGQSWPLTYSQQNAVTVTFTAGYGNAAAVPQVVKQAIQMLVAHRYAYRGITVDSRLSDTAERAWEKVIRLLSWGSYP